jgi:DNA-directed RNA polymerase subunit RPC12/RpoP
MEETDFKDKTLKCADCGKEFIFTARDQAFFAEKGFTEPKRCKECRDARKNNKNSRGNFGTRRFENKEN